MKLRYLAIAALTAVLTACGKVSLNVDNVLPSIGEGAIKMSNGAEFVAASQKGERTANRYIVDTSTGSTFGNLITTTPGGYKIYSTVQGQLTSEIVQQAEAKAAAAAAAAY